MAYEKNPDELGALWIKHGPKSDYMTGEINGVKVVVFRSKEDQRQITSLAGLEVKTAHGHAV